MRTAEIEKVSFVQESKPEGQRWASRVSDKMIEMEQMVENIILCPPEPAKRG